MHEMEGIGDFFDYAGERDMANTPLLDARAIK
jgi:hypothetical protein